MQDSSAFTPLVVCGAGEYLAVETNSIDLVFSHKVLEHVQNDQAAIREIARVPKPGGGWYCSRPLTALPL